MNIEIKKIFYILMFVIMSNPYLHAMNNQDAFIINEINTHGNWIELYANSTNLISPVSGWKATVCVDSSATCRTIDFSFDISTNPTGYFYVIDFGTSLGNWNNNPLDVRIRDSIGNEVNYFNLGLKVKGKETSLPVPSSVVTSGIYDTNCDYVYRENASESNFARKPDGGCSIIETRHGDNTKGGSNDGGVGPWVPPSLNYQFDAWDTFRNINDRNISTKIAAQNFSLTLVALNETNNAYQDINATVCTQIIDLDNGNTAVSTWVTSVFQSQSTANVSFNVATAVKNSAINIIWKKDVVGTCPLSSADGTTFSSDNFAIRPDHFLITSTPDPASTPNYYAGESFKVDITANNIDGSNTNNYDENQTSGSFIIEANEINSACRTAVESMLIDPASFSHGIVVPSLNAVFSGIAKDLNINIHEVLGSEYALVDSDDTLDESVRLITPADTDITVLPYEINVTQTDISASTGMDWLYMADVNDMNITVHTQVQVNNKQHSVLADFNSTCYAEDINITFGVDTNGNALLDMNYSAIDGVYIDGFTFKNAPLQDVNQTMTISATDFVDGVGNASMAFNVDRDFSIPINPFFISGLGTSVTPTALIKSVNNDLNLVEGNIVLYYGRVRPIDIETTLLPVTNPLVLEVYDTGSPYTSGMQQNSLFWYVNKSHIGNDPGYVFEAVASSDTGIDNALTGYGFTYNSVLNGQQDLDIIAGLAKKATIHLKTQEWLWYVPSSFGSAYDDGPGTDCTMHPCFNLSLINSSAFIIESGDFNGTVIPSEDRGDHYREGIKLFR